MFCKTPREQNRLTGGKVKGAEMRLFVWITQTLSRDLAALFLKGGKNE